MLQPSVHCQQELLPADNTSQPHHKPQFLETCSALGMNLAALYFFFFFAGRVQDVQSLLQRDELHPLVERTRQMGQKYQWAANHQSYKHLLPSRSRLDTFPDQYPLSTPSPLVYLWRGLQTTRNYPVTPKDTDHGPAHKFLWSFRWAWAYFLSPTNACHTWIHPTEKIPNTSFYKSTLGPQKFI